MMYIEEEIKKTHLFKKLKERYPVKWNEEAIDLLNDRYLIKDNNGNVIETKEELIYRVITTITSEIYEIERYYSMMANGIFLPNTPTLVNAQRELGVLSACLVLPVGDSIEEWGQTLRNHMVMVKHGIGIGIDISPIRQKGAMINSTKGQAGGAMGYLQLINECARLVKQGSIRPSANMGTMRITHPEIINFINSKKPDIKIDENGNNVKLFNKLDHFNISITAFDDELQKLFNGEKIPIVEPHTGLTIGYNDGKKLMDMIAKNVHTGGDPGLINLTKLNENNLIVNLINPITNEFFGFKMTTNPCGEQGLYSFSVCNLGSINLTKFVNNKSFDFNTFSIYVEWCIEFLDNVIDVNNFPIYEIGAMSKYLRNIGLGIMGWADTLLMMEIPYDSEKALDVAEEIMSVFKQTCEETTTKLAERKGIAPVFKNTNIMHRNYEKSCIAPTGSISFIVNVSSGIEPNFTFAYTRKTSLKNGKSFFVVNPILKKYIMDNKPNKYKEIINDIINNGGIIDDKISKKMGIDKNNFFKTTFDVSPEWHIRHQAIFQKYVDNAVSKTINVPETFTEKQIKKAYEYAWKLGCKGITLYRNKSRDYQILNSDKINNNDDGKKKKKEIKTLEEQIKEKKKTKRNNKSIVKKPKLLDQLIQQSNICCDYPNVVGDSGCEKCINCGWSICS